MLIDLQPKQQSLIQTILFNPSTLILFPKSRTLPALV